MRVAATAAAAVTALLAAAGCGHDATGPKKVEPSVRVVAGAGVTDTVLTAPVQAVVVEVRDTLGKPVEGAVVRFEVVPSTVPNRPYEAPLYVCTLVQASCGGTYAPAASFVVDTTRSDGRASAIVRLGTIAGAAWLRVKVPELGLRDSAAFTVLPGAAARVRIDVADTAVYVDATYDLHAATADQFGNARTEPVTFASDNVVAVSAAGIVTGKAYGRGRVIASRNGAADTAYVSVVPTGHVVVYRTYGPGPSALVEFNLDGSGYRVRAPMTGNNSGFTSWLPSGVAIYHDGADYDNPRIYRATASGVASLFLAGDVTVPTATRYAQPSRDGAYVYFYGAGSGYTAGIFRARADGTHLEAVAGAEGATMPAPSPDGSRVAFVRDGAINVLTVATGAVSSLGVSGSTPRWSPAGDLIAYTSNAYGGPIGIVSADGGGARTIATVSPSLWLDWSPDAQWIVASESGQVVVVRVSDGLRLPIRLPPLGQHFQPSWM